MIRSSTMNMFWTLMEDAEQTSTRNKENWIDALSRSTDKPRMDNCQGQNGTVRPHSRRSQSTKIRFLRNRYR